MKNRGYPWYVGYTNSTYNNKRVVLDECRSIAIMLDPKALSERLKEARKPSDISKLLLELLELNAWDLDVEDDMGYQVVLAACSPARVKQF